MSSAISERIVTFTVQGDLVSEGRDETATDRFRRGQQAGRVDPHRPPPREPRQAEPAAAPGASAKRWNTGRDIVAAVLLLIAPLFPFNLYFGIGVPHSNGMLFALLAVATVLSLLAVAVSIATKTSPLTGRFRLGLNAPYLLLVAGFVAFDVLQTVRYGGSADVPGGVGPGAWLGLGGALLSAQPALAGTAADDDGFRQWLLSTRLVGYVSIALAALSVLFNLFWRVKAALPGSANSAGFGAQNVSIIATAVVYGVVAFAAVAVASRWVLQGDSRSSRLATIALGASTLVAGVIVWLLPLGREIDGFHGIAQNTSTAGVGFEGYLPWVAAAAIFAPLTLIRVVTTRQIDRGVWRAAARKALVLIALWCLASVLMRVTDVIVAAVLHLSRSPYDSAVMVAFDVVTAVLAVWLRINLVNRSLPVAVISALSGVLLVFTVARIVVGNALAPRVAGTTAEAGNSIYGNNLAQQITSTFDVVVSGLALCILVVAIITARFVQRRPQSGDRNRSASLPPTGWDAETTRLGAGATEPPAAGWQRSESSPRIHRSTDQPTRRISVGAGRDSGSQARQQPPSGAPRILRTDSSRQGNLGPTSQRPGQQPSTGAPTIHRSQQDPRQPPGGEPTSGERPR
jgi:hypothetical protein